MSLYGLGITRFFAVSLLLVLIINHNPRHDIVSLLSVFMWSPVAITLGAYNMGVGSPDGSLRVHKT